MLLRTVLGTIGVVLLLAACTPLLPGNGVQPPSSAQPTPAGAEAAPAPGGAEAAPIDYADPANWLNLPLSGTYPVDVFYLYPSSFQKASPDSPNIAAIDDPGMRQRARSAYGRQATAFEPLANVYAPFYRQADAVYTLNLPPAQHDAVIGGIPTQDATAALTYYLDHYNQGRPFILAGHSQGSNVLINLLADTMRQRPADYQRMIVAYVIGYSVTPDYLARNPHLEFAAGPDDTGVIVSYNTEAPTIGGPNPVVLPGALAINPITWTRSDTLATADQNPGSIQLNPDGSAVLDSEGRPLRVKDFADAQVDLAKGVVVCSTAPVAQLAPGNALFPAGVFHTFDYPFYYFSIQDNAANRIHHYLVQPSS